MKLLGEDFLLSPISSTVILFYFILFYFTSFYFILFFFILFYFSLCNIIFYFTSSLYTLFYLLSFYMISMPLLSSYMPSFNLILILYFLIQTICRAVAEKETLELRVQELKVLINSMEGAARAQSQRINRCQPFYILCGGFFS